MGDADLEMAVGRPPHLLAHQWAAWARLMPDIGGYLCNVVKYIEVLY